MSRKIYLPELVSINIKNYTLYPNGLDYTYDFVKGVNLILGGNGMGKTTFVNIIKYALIGPYRQQFDYSRTYLEKKVEKREKELGFFSQAVKDKKESLYDHVHVSVKTMDKIIWVVSGLLVIVIILIILEATGIFKL